MLVAGNWDATEMWVPQPDGQTLRCCHHAYSIKPTDDQEMMASNTSSTSSLSSDSGPLWSLSMSRSLIARKKFRSAQSFHEVSRHYLVELNNSIVSGTNPIGDYSVIWCDHLASLSQARFPRAPLV
jgi:hypothetical protein